jgi:hypothetical protein
MPLDNSRCLHLYRLGLGTHVCADGDFGRVELHYIEGRRTGYRNVRGRVSLRAFSGPGPYRACLLADLLLRVADLAVDFVCLLHYINHLRL